MSRFNEAMRQAGVLLALDGLTPPGAGVRVSFEGGEPKVTEGPVAGGAPVASTARLCQPLALPGRQNPRAASLSGVGAEGGRISRLGEQFMKCIRFHEHGGPEVLRVEDCDLGRPAPGEAQVRHSAIGLNYIDVYDRTGLYPGELPSGLGREAAGVIVALGRNTRGFRMGDRVAYVHSKPGAYCELRNVPTDRLVRVPRSISDEQAAAIMLKGLTARSLLRRTYRVQRGDTLLVHAAAGGVGLILTQWAKALGAKVIGVVGSEAKAELARRNGCRHVLIRGRDEWVEGVRTITRGQGVAVVYDSVGKDTFMASLDCLRPLGMMVSYGNASGPPPAISPLELSKRGSLYLTRPTLFSYIARRADLDAAARELFSAVRKGMVRVRVGQRYPLADAAAAHRDLEARRTTGSTVLMP